MAVKITELQCKEVICTGTGQRLGFVSDVCIEVPEGRVSAIVVPCPGRGLLPGRPREEYRIGWDCIRRIGPDIVLVEACPEECRVRRPGRGSLV